MRDFLQTHAACSRSMPRPEGDARTRADVLIDWLRAGRLLSLVSLLSLLALVAQRGGGTQADALQVVFDISARSGSAGLTYAMHLAQVRSVVGHSAGSPHLMQVLAETSQAKGLVGSVASEVKSPGKIHDSDNWILRTRAECSLAKDSTNTSYAPQAAAFLATALDGDPEKPVQRLILIGAADTGLTERHINRLLGMTGIDNRAWSFAIRFPEGAVFDEPFAVIASRSMTPATYILPAVLWSGIAASALGKARQVVRQLGDDAAAATETLTALRHKHFTINALIRDALADLAANPGRTVSLGGSAQINRLKIVGSDLACDVVLGALKLCGLRGYAESGPVSVAEEPRDTISGPVMVSNARLQTTTLTIDRFSEERP